MVQLFLLFILSIPFFAVAKVLSRSLNVSPWKILFYGFFWIVALVLLLKGEAESVVLGCFLLPIGIHLFFIIVIFIYKWSFKVLES